MSESCRYRQGEGYGACDDESLPRRKENGTAPKRVACQSSADRTAKQSTSKLERLTIKSQAQNAEEW